MIERFTFVVRNVFAHANLAATGRGHQFMGCEHVLLGMLREGKCPAARVLKEAGVDLEAMEQEMDRLILREAPGEDNVKLPMTPRAKKMMMRTVEVAMRMGHNSIGTEHFLHALLENPEEVQIELLNRLGHDVEAIRERTLELLARYEDKAK